MLRFDQYDNIKFLSKYQVEKKERVLKINSYYELRLIIEIQIIIIISDLPVCGTYNWVSAQTQGNQPSRQVQTIGSVLLARANLHILHTHVVLIWLTVTQNVSSHASHTDFCMTMVCYARGFLYLMYFSLRQ